MRQETIENRWTGPGTSNEVPRAVIGNHNNQNSSRFLEDGSYLRLQSVTVGYRLPDAVTGPLNARSVRVALAAKNLFTITGYSGMDPEVNMSLDPRTLGIDRYNVPQMRAFVFSATVGL
jgi:TonB-dependent starch-binding outer membrane protein SusC